MKVLFAIAEAAPFVTSGGLGEIGGSLPKALAEKGVDVRVAMPKYSAIPQSLLEKAELVFELKVAVGWRSQYCAVFALLRDGVTFYFFENDYYFCRDGIYGYYDEAERFTFFCRAVMDALPGLGFVPDVIHCHDWQTALIPILLNNGYQYDPFYTDVKSVFTIHNVKYQGVFPMSVVGNVAGLTMTPDLWEKIEFYDAVNLMKGAVYYAQRVTTVSPSYAHEIMDPYFGERLDGVLRANAYKLSGILNGIDGDLYDPVKDPHIFTRFRNSPALKEENKAKLSDLLGLPAQGLPIQDLSPRNLPRASSEQEREAPEREMPEREMPERERIPLLAIVTRFVENKGIDLVLRVFHDLMQEDLHLVVLGSGEWHYEQFFSAMAAMYPGKFSVYLGYNVELAHRIYAAADILLMPSRYEPCGISQMIAMRYGTIPIVRETGGLKDSVQSYNHFSGEGNGFSFANYNAHEMLETIKRAVGVYRDTRAWRKLFRNALATDFLWDSSAQKYVELYQLTVDS
ncbi:MAG: glycogen synthase [Peptococcaceae bacterium]|nr:glycogen synthase [Peptococcaceae bacterium]